MKIFDCFPATCSDFSVYLDHFTSCDLSGLDKENSGGIGPLGAFTLFSLILSYKPDCYVESGCWKGFSLGVARSALAITGSNIPIYAFDPDLNKIQVKPENCKYADRDIATPLFQDLLSNKVAGFIFFDDHQDVFERLLLAWSRGFKWALFDDDYSGHADHRTFRNSLLSSFQKDSIVSSILELIIDELYLITDPSDIIASSSGGICFSNSHWRDQAFVVFKPSPQDGWTMGKSADVLLHYC